LWNPNTVSYSGSPIGTPLWRWATGTGVCSNSCAASNCSCRSASHRPIRWAPSTGTRTGRVLTNWPTRSATPGRSTGRPVTVVPNTTSDVPAHRASSNAQAACTMVLGSSLRARARTANRWAWRSST
jgi:hypothetical protein